MNWYISNILLLFFIQLSTSEEDQCPDGWRKSSSSSMGCIKFFHSEDLMSWGEAVDFCHRQDSYLIDKIDENLQTQLEEFASGLTGSYWMGLTDINRPNQWYWTNSLLAATYFKVHDRYYEPGKHYAYIDTDNSYDWFKADYNEKHKPLCARNPSQSPCIPAEVEPSTNTYEHVTDGIEVDTIAFGSCYYHEDGTEELGQAFWKAVRDTDPDVWLWLGDNVYSDGSDMDVKRRSYNAARDKYLENGLLSPDKKIPVMGIWDDHDYAYNDAGSEYLCPMESQDEFCIHLNVPETDPRHPDYAQGQRQVGVYNAKMFKKPNSDEDGIHVIMLDNRSGRDPTFARFGACKGSATHMLSDDQWAWLDAELTRPSEVKIIASGIQVLPPTDQTKAQDHYCADDSHSDPLDGTFQDAIHNVGESKAWTGSPHEIWGQIPQERERLLAKAQKCLNAGHAQVIVFASGDQHYGELMAKRMHKSPELGDSQVLYEITASGIFQDWNERIQNSNRLRDRSCDDKGVGPFVRSCALPFTYNGVTYNDCTDVDDEYPWCSYRTYADGSHIAGQWGYCDFLENELIQTAFSNSTRLCSDGDKKSKYFICTAQSNFGVISVDFEQRRLRMTVKTPTEKEEMYHEISY